MEQQTIPTSPRIGIVLSSGGVQGVYAHTGFLLAMDSMGVDVKAVSGCSAGAVVGGIFASGTHIKDWAEVLKNIQPRRFWRPEWLRLFWSLLARRGKGCTGISSTDTARIFCQEQLKVQTFEECKYPFRSLAINISTGGNTVFSD